MNIFATSHCPENSARELPDKLLVKMVVETAQIMSTVHRIVDGDEAADAHCLYKATHAKHPSVLWAAASLLNYRWLAKHLGALCAEYTERYGKEHKVSSSGLLAVLAKHEPVNIPQGPGTKLPACMPEEFIYESDELSQFPICSYQNYLANGKSYVQDGGAWARAKQVPYWYAKEKRS